MNVVVIPCFNRPEFLYYVLKQIVLADEANKYIYAFALDYGYDRNNLEIIKEFPYIKIIIETPKTQYIQGKQSYNLLRAITSIQENSDGIIYLIEDDILIGKDYFTMSEDIHKEIKDPIVILSRNHNTRFVTENNMNAYYFGAKMDYQGWAVSFKKDFIKEKIEPHYTVNYFSNPIGYLATHFPCSSIGTQYCEQDGLIRRIIEKENIQVCFAHVPRAYHCGFYSYHRGESPHIPLKDKINWLDRIIYSKEQMKLKCKTEFFQYDSEPCNLITSHDSIQLINAKREGV